MKIYLSILILFLIFGNLNAVDFAKDIKPIIKERCTKCHSGQKRKGGLSIDTRELILKGGENGKVLIPGNSAKSKLIELITSKDDDEWMPPKGDRLTAKEIKALKDWIDQGAKWPDGFAFAEQFVRAPLKPRKPALPSNSAKQPIDKIVYQYLSSKKMKKPVLVDDQTYIRRVYLDIIGLLPSSKQISDFTMDKSADKRLKLVDSLLSRNADYADKWLAFWNDLLRNAYIGTGFITGGRKHITSWLYSALMTNKPYNSFAYELISGTGGSEGFIRGITWRGNVNESQGKEMQAVQNVFQVFMGSNMKCASCHDSFINDWKLNDTYRMAAVFADKPMEVHRCDKPTGLKPKPGFLYPELGQIDPSKPKAERMKATASLLTKKENGRLSRTVVNRIWYKMLGKGIVEPLDEMDQKPWSQDLLDYLAWDFAENGYDIKRLIRQIAISRAYQFEADRNSEKDFKKYQFKGPIVKRMSAEQFLDAVSHLTGVWGPNNQKQVKVIASVRQKHIQTPKSAKIPELRFSGSWIWPNKNAMKSPGGENAYFRYHLTPKTKAGRILWIGSGDNSYTLYINGRKIHNGKEWNKVGAVDITKYIKAKALIAVHARNGGSGPNAAGFIGQLFIYDRSGKLVETHKTGAGWKSSSKVAGSWQSPKFNDASWQAASVIGNASMAPWNINKISVKAGAGATVSFKVRASHTELDPLKKALGCPTRDQVISQRDSEATLLQALELMNGSRFDASIKSGAAKWQAANLSKTELVTALYLQGLGRKPSSEELKLTVQMMSAAVKSEEIADILWSLTMLPEFQLIY